MSEEKIYQNAGFLADKPFISLSTVGIPMAINLPEDLWSTDDRQVKINLQAFGRKSQERVQNARKKALAKPAEAEKIYQEFVDTAGTAFMNWVDEIKPEGSVGKDGTPANIRMARAKLADKMMSKDGKKALASIGVELADRKAAIERAITHHQNRVNEDGTTGSPNWHEALKWADAQIANKAKVKTVDL